MSHSTQASSQRPSRSSDNRSDVEYVLGPQVTDISQTRPADLLMLVAAAPQTKRLAFSRRRGTLDGLPSCFATAAASNGFYCASADDTTASLQCVVCGATVSVERQLIVEGAGSRDDVDCGVKFRHRLGCQFERLVNLCIHGQTSASPVSSRLLAHLRREIASTKAAVAREFLFNDDAICTALGVRFLSIGEPYPNAGLLVDDLTDLVIERGEEDPLSVVPGLAQQVGVSEMVPVGATETPARRNGLRMLAGRPQGASAETTESLERQTLLEETVALYTRTLCRECANNKVEYVALPCGHLSLCGACAKGASQCPSCQQPVQQLVKTYVP